MNIFPVGPLLIPSSLTNQIVPVSNKWKFTSNCTTLLPQRWSPRQVPWNLKIQFILGSETVNVLDQRTQTQESVTLRTHWLMWTRIRCKHQKKDKETSNPSTRLKTPWLSIGSYTLKCWSFQTPLTPSTRRMKDRRYGRRRGEWRREYRSVMVLVRFEKSDDNVYLKCTPPGPLKPLCFNK